MEIINKGHQEITEREKISLVPSIRFGFNNTITFSAKAVKDFGLKEGLTVNFINDENEWWFYCDNNEDGFRINERKSRSRKDVYIYSGSLIVLFLKRTKMSCPVKLLLTETNAKKNGCTLIKIETNKPIE